MYFDKNEKEWILLFQKGDSEVFQYIFDLFYLRLQYFAEQIIQDKDKAKDLVADTFLKLWLIRQNFESLANIRAFLYITLRNASFDHLRYRKSQSELQNKIISSKEFEASLDDEIIKSELLSQIYLEIEKLPTECKRVFKLGYLDGYSNQEIADMLNVSINTIKTHKLRALKILRSRLGELFKD